MRTNPFFDAWLFLIGSTDDHNALGLFKYVFVALFVALLAASAWIAVANWRADPGQRTVSHLSTFVCRVLIGSMWFQGCLWKLPLPFSDGFKHWTGQMADNAAFEFHRALVKSIYLPYLHVIDPLVFLAELAFAASLLLGLGVRLAAFIGVFYSLHLWLGLYLHPAEWPWNYMFLAIVHVLFVVCAAGRSLGLDAWLRRDVPAVRERTGWWGRLLGAMG
jgi:uncharacterized membrane protein YphA (DoxX/SURF4 family)